jgi:hypothetical protein
MFGLVSKAAYEAAERLRVDANQRLGQSEVARIKDLDAARDRYAALKELHLQARAELDRFTDHAARLEAELAEEKLENRILLDRIVQMSGQPALFEKAAPAPIPAAPAPPASTLPGPAARPGFDDVHRAAREAIKDGTFSLKGRPN